MKYEEQSIERPINADLSLQESGWQVPHLPHPGGFTYGPPDHSSPLTTACTASLCFSAPLTQHRSHTQLNCKGHFAYLWFLHIFHLQNLISVSRNRVRTNRMSGGGHKESVSTLNALVPLACQTLTLICLRGVSWQPCLFAQWGRLPV